LNFETRDGLNNALTYTEEIFDFGEFQGPAFVQNKNTRILSWNMILTSIYLSGVLIYVLRLTLSSIRLRNLSKSTNTIEYQGFKLTPVNNNWCFSYLNRIFINPKKLKEDSSKYILEHELAHIKQRHSLDLIFSELASALLWFNPFVFFHKKSLRTIHEFLADEQVLDNNNSFADYVDVLIEQNFYKSYAVANDFRSSTIKNRVKMMSKNKSKSYKKASYLLILPMAFTLALIFSQANAFAQSPPPPPPPKGKKEVAPPPPPPPPPAYKDEFYPDIAPIEDAKLERIASEHGKMIDPFTKKERFHNGLDIVAKNGTPIYATASGIVAKKTDNEKGWGKSLIIDHGNGYSTAYAHMSAFKVKLNQKIMKGQVIGYVGNTGRSTAPHLHYEIRKKTKHLDPRKFYKYKK